MAKVTLSRIFETSKAKATKAGQELIDFITFVADFAELVLRILRNGITFADNIDCEMKTITIRNNAETVISIVSSKRPVQIVWRRVFDPNYYVVSDFGWKFNNNGNVVLKMVFAGSPAADLDITVDIMILFG